MTNLALWVGAFAFVVIFKVEVDDEGLEDLDLTTSEKYFARYMLLGIMGAIQGAITTIGNLIIGVQTVNAPLYILTDVITSLVYLSITFALSTSFMHIGKGLCVALIIVQIPGASGLYPIEMMPKFFRMVYPFVPFSYSIDAFRETIAGFYDGHWLKSIGALLMFAVVAFFIGLAIRPLLVNLNRLFARQIKESDMIIGETTCDGKKKMYEMLADFKPVYVIELPNRQSEEGIAMYRREIIRFKEELERRFETTITEEAIRHEIHLNNEITKSLLRLQYLMANDPAPVSGLNIVNTAYGSGFNMDVESLPARINDLADQIEAEYAAGKNEGKKPRILVTGSPSGGAALKVIRAIEDAGAVVVAFENCSGLKSMLLTDEENPDVYDALARRYLGIGCSCMSPNPNRLAMLDKLIDEFHVDGVVDIILQACHTYNVETALVGKLVKEKKGIPYTVVETDYSQSDVGQIQTRMAAFVEML